VKRLRRRVNRVDKAREDGVQLVNSNRRKIKAAGVMIINNRPIRVWRLWERE
jgi:hypothetical protein